MYGWTQKGHNGYIQQNSWDFYATFIVAFSEDSIHGILVNKSTNYSETFIYF